MRILSLFSGIGTTELAARSIGFETAAFCEIDEFAQAILARRFPGVPICTDIKNIKGDEFEAIDVICGGFPCQDLSVAGKKAGLEGARSGLWFEMLRVIREVRPRYVLAENVRGAINLALDTVTAGLEDANYEVRTSLIPASLFGAPHQRYRIFILGVRCDVADALADVLRERQQRAEEYGVNYPKGAQSDDEFVVKCGSGLWRTPDASSGRGALSEETYQKRKKKGLPLTINAQVAHVERTQWPTPSVCGNSNRKGASAKSGDGLSTAVKRKKVGQLNPDWVECLQGLPIGWTDPGCETPVPWPGWPAPPDARPSTHLQAQVFIERTGQFSYEPPRTVTGMKNRAARLKALGNCNPPQMYVPFLRVMKVIHDIAQRRNGQ